VKLIAFVENPLSAQEGNEKDRIEGSESLSLREQSGRERMNEKRIQKVMNMLHMC